MAADDSRGEGVDEEIIGSRRIGGSVPIGSKRYTSRPAVTRTRRAPTSADFTTTPLPNGAEVAAQLIKEALNRTYAPCDDFYNFVCSTFSGGQDAIRKLGARTEEAIKHMLTTMDIPARFQRATEKAAGLYRACVSLASNPKGYQVGAVKAFLSKLRLDISNIDHAPNFDIVRRLVYLSFVYGFPAFVKFSVKLGLSQEPILDMSINNEDEDWMETTRLKFNGLTLNLFYMKYLYIYDRHLDSDPIVERILRAERVVMDHLTTNRPRRLVHVFGTVGKLGNFTKGYASEGHWVRLIEQATANRFKANSVLVMRDNAPAFVVLLLDRKRMARNDSRLLVAWSLVHQLLPLAFGKMMDSEAKKRYPGEPDRVTQLCYEKVVGVMPLAVSQRYFSTCSSDKLLSMRQRTLENVRVLWAYSENRG
ncbi:uncharacterized protein LOC144134514 [Amblyomma americanum]